MAAKLAHALAALEVPATSRAIVRAAEDVLAGADDPVDGGLVAFEHRHTTARRHVPLTDRLVGAATQNVHVLDQDTVDVIVIVIVFIDVIDSLVDTTATHVIVNVIVILLLVT